MKDLTAQYLKKLNIDESQPPFALLQEICEKHLTHFTFNNLEVLLHPNEILSLDVANIAEKIIEKGLGGYCFEHNKLLFTILNDLGFCVEAYLARVLYGQEGDFPRTHRLNLVKIKDELYVIDVGFGPNTPLCPIPLSGTEVECVNGARFRISQNKPEQYTLELFKEDGYLTLYCFERVKVTEADFDMSNFYTNWHPDSKFVKELLISKVSAKETIFITQKHFSQISPSGRVDKEIQTIKDLGIYLKTLFNIELDDESLEIIYRVIQR